MAIVPDLSGNTPYVDTHIAEPGGAGGGGDASAANQVLANTKLDEIKTLIGTTNTNTGNIVTNTGEIETALAGTLHVSVAGLAMEPVAASQTDQMLGTTGAAGDILEGIWIIPATLNPGPVSIENGSTNYPIFTGGTDSVSNLVPFYFPFGAASVGGGWEVTTGADVSVIAVGTFT